MPMVLSAQRHCATMRVPDPLPLAMQLIDSAALAAELPSDSLPPTVFSLWYDEYGQLTHALALSDSLVTRGALQPDSGAIARAVIGTRIAAAAFPQDSGAEMTVRLTLARNAAGALSFAVSHSVRCSAIARRAPRPPNDRRSATRDDIAELGHATTAMVSFVIDTTGHPLELLIMQSSGSRLIDTSILESIESTRYEPSTVDGFPKKVTMKISVLPPLRRP